VTWLRLARLREVARSKPATMKLLIVAGITLAILLTSGAAPAFYVFCGLIIGMRIGWPR
jgi:hypothetical protein